MDMAYRFKRLGWAALVAGVGTCLASSGIAQDAVWEHQQHIQAQQAEQRRIMEMGADQACCDEGGQAGPGQDENAARFNYFPPEAWEDFIRHGREVELAAERERRERDPAYRELAEGTWTFDSKVTKRGVAVCAATFWTLRGGVVLAHWGGTENITLLGYFGLMVPNPKKPRLAGMDLTQSGEVQSVRAINMHFPPAKQMGIALFTVPSAKALVDSIEDKQDFKVDMKGETIIYGAWHSGLKARAALATCLKKHGQSGR